MNAFFPEFKISNSQIKTTQITIESKILKLEKLYNSKKIERNLESGFFNLLQ